MDSHEYLEGFEVKERQGRFYREAEQWRLMRLAKSQNDGDQGRWSAASVWNPVVAGIGRTAGSIRVALRDARARWIALRRPQEQRC
jgi:hypothetical protein